MRFFEKQPGESDRAWAGFQIYRDLGQARSIDKAYRIYTGQKESDKRASGRFTKWSQDHDWLDRAQAYDDYHEMVRREAIEQYERREGVDLTRRAVRVQEELLGVKELLLLKLQAMAQWPLERTEEESEDGKTIVHIYPARWSFSTLIRAIEVLDDSPDKIAFTNPTGEHGWGQPPEDIRRLFAEILEAEWDDESSFPS
jgi:hypothetical protein